MRAILCILSLLMHCFANAQIEKIKIIGFTRSDCEPYSDPFRIQTRIIDQKEYGNVLSIKIGTSASCCTAFVPTAMLKSNGLYLNYDETRDACECPCYYELIYDLPRLNENIKQIFFQDSPIEISDEKFKTFDIDFELFNGDTIDFQDKFGRKQGKWHLNKTFQITDTFAEFKNDTLIRQVSLYPNGVMKSEVRSGKLKINDEGKSYWIFTFANNYLEYFENGLLRRECNGKTPMDAYWDGSCKEWNERGELIYEGPYKK